MFRRWTLAGVVLLAGLAAGITTGSPIIVVVFAALAAAASPLIFPRSETAAEAQTRSVEDGRAVIYWRPGCPFCVRLRATLGPAARRAHWVDIWRDPEAAAAVRAVADGNETVPTVVLDGVPHVNPDPGWLRKQLLAA
ncbi:glutaredoxin domain-containing protein [Actinoplanes sp. NPDC026623]|uniref:glutaredoxin domain-containing protein n=1 Tax=Actinoplanes sp. NPDC026623 TaxID=3155610 RepID=UPI0033CCA792